MGRGTVPRHEAIDIPRPIDPPTASMVIIGQMDAPPSSGTVQNSGVPKTRNEAAKMAAPNDRMSEMRTDLRKFRPMASYDTLQWPQDTTKEAAMTSLFTKIINREIPGRFVYEDDVCVAFLTIEPLSPGHTLVVPRTEVDHWIDLDADTLSHLMSIAQRVGRAIENAYAPTKVGLMIAGLEVPHVHIHVTQMNNVNDLDFARANKSATDVELDEAAETLQAALNG
jgi:histidine triad (HIT) family protein